MPPSSDGLDWVPFGIVIAAESRRIASCNVSAARILGDTRDDQLLTKLTCCELLCGHVDSKKKICLSKLAMSHGRALPEIRIDVEANGSGKRGVWVTAEPTINETGIAFLLRPGTPGDRRRRTRPHWLHDTRIYVHSLGTTRVEAGETTLDGDWLGHRPGQVFKYLLCRRPDIVQPDEITEALRSQPDSKAPGSIRYYVHALRSALEPDRKPRSPSSFVLARSGGYTLSNERVWVDADEFEDLVRAGVATRGEGDAALAVTQFERAAALYRGDFLTDELYADWAIEERERLKDLASKAFQGLVELRLAAGDHEVAAGDARRLAELEPLDNAAQRQYLELCLLRGRRTEASRRYDAYSRRLEREFGETPNFTLVDIAKGGPS